MSVPVAALSPARAAWAWSVRAAPWLLALLVTVLLVRQARHVHWHEVWQALLQQQPWVLATAGLLALASHTLVSSYDLLARRLTRHRVAAPHTLRIAATCYAFNLNFGALVGALAIRLRLYARAGLPPRHVARIIAVAVVTNWVGYLVLGGLVVALAPPPLPPPFELPSAALRAIGVAMFGVGAAYPVLCAVRRGRVVRLRGLQLALPPLGLALGQVAVSALNWALMGLIVWLLLGRAVPYPTALAVLLLAAVAGVVTHVPAGLGVIEAVFVACLGAALGSASVLAALLSYRALYYLLPLALAVAGYAAAEVQARRGDRTRPSLGGSAPG